MEKKIEDYMFFYIGQEVQYLYKGEPMRSKMSIGLMSWIADKYYTNFILLLRPLSDMTDEEAIYIAEITSQFHHLKLDESKIIQVKGLFEKNGYYNKATNLSGTQWNAIIGYCRKIGIDMDSLIDEGLAINKTTL